MVITTSVPWRRNVSSAPSTRGAFTAGLAAAVRYPLGAFFWHRCDAVLGANRPTPKFSTSLDERPSQRAESRCLPVRLGRRSQHSFGR